MDQTDFAVTGGIVLSVGGGIAFRAMTGWDSWLAVLCGGILTFFLAAIVLFLIVAALSTRAGKKENQNANAKSVAEKDAWRPQ